MNDVRAIRYLGMALLCGCSVGLLFTFVFMLVLSLSGFGAYYALSFFSSFAVAGGVAAFFSLKCSDEGLQIVEVL